METKQQDVVRVEIELPSSLHRFVKKLAHLENSNAEKWYSMWAKDGFKAFLDTLRGTPIDIDPSFDTI